MRDRTKKPTPPEAVPEVLEPPAPAPETEATILPAPPEMTLVQRQADTLVQVAEEALRLGQPIRIRIQPQLFEREANLYRAWANCVWIANLTNQTAAANLKQGLDTFFRLANLWGPTELAEYLARVERESLAPGTEQP